MTIEALYALERALLKYRGIRYVSTKPTPYVAYEGYVTFEGPRTNEGAHGCHITFYSYDLEYPDEFGAKMADNAYTCMMDGARRQADERGTRQPS